MTVKSLLVKIGADVSEYEKGIQSAQKKTEDMAKGFERIGRGLSIGISLPLAGVGAAATKLAMEAIESDNLFSVAMGDMAADGTAFSKQLREQFGLNEYAIRKQLGTFFQMTSTMGLTKNQALELSKGFTQLGYDMASFYNLSPEEAFEKLQSGISGEIEPLKRLGIVITEDMVKQYALSQGLITQGEELNQAGKTWVRYQLIMQQTKNAQGDLARTMDSPTNKLRIMMDRAKLLVTQLGMGLMPAFSGLLSAAKPLFSILEWGVNVFNSLPAGIKTTMVVLLGLTAAAGPVLIVVAKLIQIAPALSKGLLLVKTVAAGLGVTLPSLTAVAGALKVAFSAMLGPIGLVVAAAGAAAVVFWKVHAAQKAAAEAAKQYDQLNTAFGKKLWEIAQAAGLTKEQFDDLTKKYGENYAALSMAIKKGTEGVTLQKAMAEHTQKATAAAQEQSSSFVSDADSAGKLKAALEKVKEQQKAVADVVKEATDSVKQATLSEYEYAKWALEQQYKDRIAKIDDTLAKAKEEAAGKIAADVEYQAQARLLEENAAKAKIAVQQAYQAESKALQTERLEDENALLAEISTAEAEWWTERLAMAQTFQDERARLVDGIKQMQLSETQYKLWAIEQERVAEETRIQNSKALSEQQKAELLAIMASYYEQKKAMAEADASAEVALAKETEASLTSVYTTGVENILGAFEEFGSGSKSILGAFGSAIKSTVNTAISELKKLVAGMLASAAKNIIAEQAQAVAGVISSVMMSVPFPLNLALVGGAIAAVNALFSAIKLGEGGLVTGPTLALVGEAGPEMVLPLNKLDLFSGAAGAAGAGTSIALHINSPLIQTTSLSQGQVDEVAPYLFNAIEDEARKRGFCLARG